MRRIYRRVYAAKALDALEGGYARGSAGDGFLPSPASASRRVRGLGQRPRRGRQMREPRSANSVRQENSRQGQRDASARMPTYYNRIIMQLRAHKKTRTGVGARQQNTSPPLRPNCAMRKPLDTRHRNRIVIRSEGNAIPLEILDQVQGKIHAIFRIFSWAFNRCADVSVCLGQVFEHKAGQF